MNMARIQTNADAGYSIVPLYGGDGAVWTLPEPWIYGRGFSTPTPAALARIPFPKVAFTLSARTL